MKLRDELIKNLTDSISYADGDGIIYCKSKKIGTWNNEANCDYPEDLTWNRDIGSLYRESFKSGAEHGFDACEAQYSPIIEKLESALKFYSLKSNYSLVDEGRNYHSDYKCYELNEITYADEELGTRAKEALAELEQFKNKINGGAK